MSDLPFRSIDHVQLAMPPDNEDVARRFYAGLLGMLEIPKPAALANRGGCWFKSGSVQVHLGVEADFRAATKAHPAFICSQYAGLLAALRKANIEVIEANDIPGLSRCHLHDPFGNRIELIAMPA